MWPSQRGPGLHLAYEEAAVYHGEGDLPSPTDGGGYLWSRPRSPARLRAARSGAPSPEARPVADPLSPLHFQRRYEAIEAGLVPRGGELGVPQPGAPPRPYSAPIRRPSPSPVSDPESSDSEGSEDGIRQSLRAAESSEETDGMEEGGGEGGAPQEWYDIPCPTWQDYSESEVGRQPPSYQWTCPEVAHLAGFFGELAAVLQHPGEINVMDHVDRFPFLNNVDPYFYRDAYDSFLRRYNGARAYLLEQALLETMEVHSWEDWGWYLGRMTAPQEQK